MNSFRCAIPMSLFLAGCVHVRVDEVTVDEGHHGGRPEGPVSVSTPAMTRILEFHGHVGPYVVLGYRMGLLARETLPSPGYFDLTADVVSPLSPPASCLIDGLQLGSGCTTGKQNLTVREGPIARATFTTKGGKTAAIALKPELPEKVQRMIDELGVERAGERLWDQPWQDLFLVEAPKAGTSRP